MLVSLCHNYRYVCIFSCLNFWLFLWKGFPGVILVHGGLARLPFFSVTGMSLHEYLGCTTVNWTMVCLLCGPSSMPPSVGKQWLECHKLSRCIMPKGSSKVLIWLAYKTAGNSLICNAFVNQDDHFSARLQFEAILCVGWMIAIRLWSGSTGWLTVTLVVYIGWINLSVASKDTGLELGFSRLLKFLPISSLSCFYYSVWED